MWVWVLGGGAGGGADAVMQALETIIHNRRQAGKAGGSRSGSGRRQGVVGWAGRSFSKGGGVGGGGRLQLCDPAPQAAAGAGGAGDNVGGRVSWRFE